MIWQLVAEDGEPRLIRLEWVWPRGLSFTLRLNAGPVPSPLLVNRESRNEMRKIYSRSKDFFNGDILQVPKGIRDKYTYANFEKDIIYFDDMFFSYDQLYTIRKFHQHLADTTEHDGPSCGSTFIRHAAIPSDVIVAQDEDCRCCREAVYEICMGNPFLKTLRFTRQQIRPGGHA